MPVHRMNNRAKIVSYLTTLGQHNKVATNEDISIGCRIAQKSVGPLVTRLIDEGLLVRVVGRKPVRGGGSQSVVMRSSWARVHGREVVVRVKPIPRWRLQAALDRLWRAGRIFYKQTCLLDTDANAELRIALDAAAEVVSPRVNG